MSSVVCVGMAEVGIVCQAVAMSAAHEAFRGGNSLTTGFGPQGGPLLTFPLWFRSRNHRMFPVGGVGMAKDGSWWHARLGMNGACADRCRLALNPATSLEFVELAWAYLRTQDTNAG